jgi:DNA-binding NtrC family response regulator
MPTVLFCDDEERVLYTLEAAMEGTGIDAICRSSGEEALASIADADVVVTDLAMPGMDGLALLAQIRAVDPELPVILLTAQGSERIAVRAIRAGAYDYLTKPFGVDELRAVVARAIETRELRRSARRHGVEARIGKPIIGQSAVWRKLIATAERVARRDVHVIVRGETGTGKELIATLLHEASARRDGPCVRFNCAAIPADLAESELFGHTRGAFTGASHAHRGYFALADHGTLVLDEIGELPLALQAKLLRAAQEGEVQAIGAGQPERVDVRIVACTHRDLRAEVSAGRFREDLYYRLGVVELEVPPLRARTGDVRLLADAFRRRYAERFDLHDARFGDDLYAALEARDWPGNVRELENTIARLLALSDGGPIGAAALGVTSEAEGADENEAAPLRAQVAAFERSILERAIARSNGNQSEAARRLGLSRATLIEKMKRHGIRSR